MSGLNPPSKFFEISITRIMKTKIYFLFFSLLTSFLPAQTPVEIQQALIARIPLYGGIDNGGGQNGDTKTGGPIKNSQNTISCLELSSLKLLEFMAAHPEYYRLGIVDIFTEDYISIYPPIGVNAYPVNTKNIEFGLETAKNFPKAYSAKVYLFRYAIIPNPSLDSVTEGNNPTYHLPGAAAYGALFGNTSPGGATVTFPFWNKTWLGGGYDDQIISPFTAYILVFTDVQRKKTKIRTDIPLTLPLITIELNKSVVIRTGFKLLWPSNKDWSVKLKPKTESAKKKTDKDETGWVYTPKKEIPKEVPVSNKKPIATDQVKEKIGQKIISPTEVEINADTTLTLLVYDGGPQIDSDAVELEAYGVTTIDPVQFTLTEYKKSFTVEPGTYVTITPKSGGKTGNVDPRKRECTVDIQTRFGRFTLKSRVGDKVMTIYVGAP
jgi:hypothetical protein